MENNTNSQKIYDAIIIGGSYSGLSAAMSLGRSLRSVLIIDSGLPCNRQTPQAHNFITQDGKTPAEITEEAKLQLQQYTTVKFHQGLVTGAVKTASVNIKAGFKITTQENEGFLAKQLIFATGVKDIMPAIEGFAPCWGISVIHCPYCHGYEFKGAVTGILDNADNALHYAELVRNLTEKLTIFTNGKANFTAIQRQALTRKHIDVQEKAIDHLSHQEGHLQAVVFKDGSSTALEALYAHAAFTQHCELPEKLGCALTKEGFIEVSATYQTSLPGVYACGDNTSFMRSIATAIASGQFAGAMANKELCAQDFKAADATH